MLAALHPVINPLLTHLFDIAIARCPIDARPLIGKLAVVVALVQILDALKDGIESFLIEGAHEFSEVLSVFTLIQIHDEFLLEAPHIQMGLPDMLGLRSTERGESTLIDGLDFENSIVALDDAVACPAHTVLLALELMLPFVVVERGDRQFRAEH